VFTVFIGIPRILQWRGFTWWGAEPGIRGTDVPQWGPEEKPRYRGSGDEVLQKGETKCEIIIQFSTFSCTEFRI